MDFLKKAAASIPFGPGLSKVTGALDKAGTALKTVATGASSLLDPSAARLGASGLLPGGLSSIFAGAGKNREPVVLGNQFGPYAEEEDWRVKISLGTRSPLLYNNEDNVGGLLEPIFQTNGVIFPYTPAITITHTARYQQQQLTHSNYSYYMYEGSEIAAIQITGEFTAQNQAEALYIMGAAYFFRSATKMFFGTGEFVGNPPPIVFLSGYGKHTLPRVSCVITQFSQTLPAEVDYMSDGNGNWVPTQCQLSVTVQPIVSRSKAASGFDLHQYSRGSYLSGDEGGGFL